MAVGSGLLAVEVPPDGCAYQNVSCRAKACRALTRRPRAIPLRKLGFPLHTATRRPRRIRFEDVFVDATSASKFKGITPEMLPRSPEALQAGRRFGRCAVVGNSGSLLLGEYGEEIDAADVVFRVNQAPTQRYAKHTGTKTDFRLLNAMWTAGYATSRR